MHLELLYRLLVFVSLYGGTIEQGYAPHYSRGLMEQVARNRDIAPASCMVSRPDGPIGSWVYVYGVNTQRLERCLVVDISHPRDKARHKRTRRITELGYDEAVRICGKKYMREPPTGCPVLVVSL